MENPTGERDRPRALAMLSAQRPRNVNWLQSAGLLFGDWGTSRLYVLGLAFLVAGRSSFWLISAMSLLILGVGWAYTHICRIYPDGGGVYTAAKSRSQVLAVIGALLLFADYTVTASLSAVDAFHYFGLGHQQHVTETKQDPGDDIRLVEDEGGVKEPLFNWRSPGLWAIVSLLVIGAFNQMGPKHTSGFALIAAVSMIVITLLVVGFALPQIDWKNLNLGHLNQPPTQIWRAFVHVVLALSGVEAIANLTGVMKKPVFGTARKSIWTVAGEVALFNVILAIAMVAHPPARNAHTGDMMAYQAGFYVGPWGEFLVRGVGGLLLLSAANTAVNGLMSITYVMSRDGELPSIFQKLNGFGAPWIGAIVATAAPVLVLLFAHDISTLASLYAIGVVGAVAINCGLCALHPRLRKMWRRTFMGWLAVILIAIWITLAFTKLHAVIFVAIVLVVGLTLRAITRYAQKKRPKPSLLRQAIMEQLPEDAMLRPKLLVATAGSAALADTALEMARQRNAALVVCFIRDVALAVGAEARLTLETDPAAQALFAEWLEHGHRHGVPIIPIYDTGNNPTEMLAEAAAISGAEKVLIGTSRRGSLHQLIKGSFQRRLEILLSPADIPVEVISPGGSAPEPKPAPEPTAPVSE
jgi:amino acid transporter/nucleotide-binding universal stress UspA family protein